jgi:hypothetical protein
MMPISVIQSSLVTQHTALHNIASESLSVDAGPSPWLTLLNTHFPLYIPSYIFSCYVTKGARETHKTCILVSPLLYQPLHSDSFYFYVFRLTIGTIISECALRTARQ